MADFVESTYALDNYAPDWIVNERHDTERAAVKTYYGFVSALRTLDEWEYTRLEFVWNGRLYQRIWHRSWGRQTITRLAREFAEDVVEESLHRGIGGERLSTEVESTYRRFAHLDHLLSNSEFMPDSSPFHRTACDLWWTIKRVRELLRITT